MFILEKGINSGWAEALHVKYLYVAQIQEVLESYLVYFR